MPLLKISDLAKSFAGTAALKGVTFAIEPGEIVGLVGENGAGKSTLIKILAGVHQADSGRIEWLGTSTQFRSPLLALRAGIATIHQELTYFEKLTVAENLLLGERWPRQFWGGTDWGTLNRLASERLSACELQIEPERLFHTLSPAQRQEIAIARALSQNSKLVILDEPTASLTEPEVERLMAHLNRLRKSGVALLYVSHRLDEILSLTDRVLVLRDGAMVSQYRTADASIERIVRDMVGRELSSEMLRTRQAPGPVTFAARDISYRGLFQNLSFEVRAGEILGFAGLIGAGRSELARAIFGLYQPSSGSMELCGKAYCPKDAAEARSRGVAYVPEERKRQGFVLEHSVQTGMSIALLDQLSRGGWISEAREKSRVREAISRFRVKVQHADQPVGKLSGGNQQKVLLARWLETAPQFIILDEPTRGVDVGAKAEIHRLIGELAASGKAILLISSDLPEVLGLSDRVLVLHRGRVAAEFQAEDATQEKILLAASGLTRA